MAELTCTYDPREMAGKPIGMFHCPECGEMVLAGQKHVIPMTDEELTESFDEYMREHHPDEKDV